MTCCCHCWSIYFVASFTSPKAGKKYEVHFKAALTHYHPSEPLLASALCQLMARLLGVWSIVDVILIRIMSAHGKAFGSVVHSGCHPVLSSHYPNSTGLGGSGI